MGEVQKVSKEAFEYVKMVALDRSLIKGGVRIQTHTSDLRNKFEGRVAVGKLPLALVPNAPKTLLK